MNVVSLLDREIGTADMAADLAWLLTSPPLLRPGALNDVLIADKQFGESWAAAIQGLDGGFADLPYPLSVANTRRLGVYAESLMAIGLRALPGYALLASRLAVHAANRTLGEYDFLLATPAGHTLHIELAVKIYLLVDGVAVGPGLQDALPLKLHVLRRQLMLATSMEGAAALPAACGEIRPLAWVRGWIFHPAATVSALPAELSPIHLRGWWLPWCDEIPRCCDDSVWRVLPRTRWMAAQPIREDCCEYGEMLGRLREHFLQAGGPLMVAEYAPPSQGGMELARGMLVPGDWPDPVAMSALKARVASRGMV